MPHLLVSALRVHPAPGSRRARSEALATRQNLYAADMLLTEKALDEDNPGRAVELRNEHRPADLPSQTFSAGAPQDVRGCERRYYRPQALGEDRFNWPQDVAVDRTGNVYVADTDNHTIRKAFRAAGPLFDPSDPDPANHFFMYYNLLPGSSSILETSANLSDWVALLTNVWPADTSTAPRIPQQCFGGRTRFPRPFYRIRTETTPH